MLSNNTVVLAAIAALLIIGVVTIIRMHDLSSIAFEDKAHDGGRFPRDVTADLASARAQGRPDRGSHQHICQGLQAAGGSVPVAFPVVSIYHKRQ
ncbi:unnamed protein product [Alternaria burnsii]|nr:unnamed protein product [Alternaria burnsii]